MNGLHSVIPAGSIVGALLLLGPSACLLTGIEPDEIDLAMGTETGANTSGTGGADEDAADDETEGQTGDGDPAGDGDGDPTGEPGDGDGEPGDGDGDNELDCPGLSTTELSEGANQVVIVDGVSVLSSTCGGAGPETVYQFTAPVEGDWQFAISRSEFTEVLTLSSSCDPLEELVCSAAPAELQQFLSQGQIVFVVVDSEAGTGTATLDISLL